MTRSKVSSKKSKLSKRKNPIMDGKKNLTDNNGISMIGQEKNVESNIYNTIKGFSDDSSHLIREIKEDDNITLTTNFSEKCDSFLTKNINYQEHNSFFDGSMTIVPSINVDLNETFKELADIENSTFDGNFNETSLSFIRNVSSMNNMGLGSKILKNRKNIDFNNLSIASPRECLRKMQEDRVKLLFINDKSILDMKGKSDMNVSVNIDKKQKEESDNKPVLRRSERIRQKMIKRYGLM
ncbi:Hypothetical protein SRAE_1000093100 [Strongyloides ratti]|uniref:Uncharacterized protein n=1 Tax=Strongyloides ratti TaxID=34506 RepID=A0A090KZ04_STRRB|nr:Hypothetical protein SRAE_1000093100 [Strongyloides ratti]CEF62661.1 Hypothetical protein SRAE_1000093100 [Strongyloides ratti]